MAGNRAVVYRGPGKVSVEPVDYPAIAEDTLLVYFAGHGRTGPRNELYLGMTDTDPDELPVSALPFDFIREVFGDSPAANRVLILDCCFSGRAIQDMSGPDEAILGQIGIDGTYTLTSAPANAVALAPIGAHYTAFTGELITLLRTGLPNGPELLTFATVYRQLLHTMTILGLPLPRQRGTGTVDQLALARNPARHPGQAPAPPSQRAGASAPAPTDTAASHHTRSRQGVQDGLHVQGKKTSYAVPLLIALAAGIFFLIMAALPWLGNNYSETDADLAKGPVRPEQATAVTLRRLRHRLVTITTPSTSQGMPLLQCLNHPNVHHLPAGIRGLQSAPEQDGRWR